MPGKKMYLIIVFVAVLIVLGILLLSLYSGKKSQQVPASTTINNAKECKVAGGDWAKWGSEHEEFCQIPAKDADKPCINGSQCQYNSCISRGESIQGKCSRYQTEFGCYSLIEQGKVVDSICVD